MRTVRICCRIENLVCCVNSFRLFSKKKIVSHSVYEMLMYRENNGNNNNE